MSGRGITTQLATALDQEHVESFLLVRMQLDGGDLCVTTTPFDVELDIDGTLRTWYTLHGLGSIEEIVETDTEQHGISFALSCVSETMLSLALSEDVQGRTVTLALVVVDRSSGTAVLRVDPVTWQGSLDVMNVDDGSTPVVRVTAEHQMIAWDEPAGLLFNHADQQMLHPGDMFFEHQAALVDATITWPTAAALRAEAGG